MTVPPFVTVASGLELPRGVPFWTDPDMVHELVFGPSPVFGTGDVAKLFGFGRNWLVMHRRRGEIGEPEIGTIRIPDAGRPNQYSLHNIERLAMVLLDRGIIEPWRAAGVVTIVKTLACQHGWLDRIQRRERMTELEQNTRLVAADERARREEHGLYPLEVDRDR